MGFRVSGFGFRVQGLGLGVGLWNPAKLFCLSTGAYIEELLPLRKNKYDGEKEYWIDYRTIGSKGAREQESLKEKISGEGATDSFSFQAGGMNEWNFDGMGHGVCQVETGKDKAPDLD